jgi:hypothetical protein
MADGPGGSGTAAPGYLVDGRAVAAGEVHGVNGVTARDGKIGMLTGMPRSFRLTCGELSLGAYPIGVQMRNIRQNMLWR